MNVVERVVQRYWGLSQAWRRGEGAEQYTYETFMEAVTKVSWHQSLAGKVANDLLQDVIRDKRHNNIGEAKIYEWPIQKQPIVIDSLTSLVQLQQQA